MIGHTMNNCHKLYGYLKGHKNYEKEKLSSVSPVSSTDSSKLGDEQK